MTSIIYQGYQWAVGFDNEAGLTPIEDDVPRFRSNPFYVHSLGTWSDGILRYGADGSIDPTGFQTFDLGADILGDNQLNYIQATKTPGGTGLSAEMTVRTLFGNSGVPDYTAVFANFNAVLWLPQKADLGQNRIWRAYRNAVLHFVVREAL